MINYKTGRPHKNWNPKSMEGKGYGIKGWYNDLHFRSSYELYFLIRMDKACKKCISDETNVFMVKYNYKGKEKRYYPDFYLPDENLIIEIKPNKILELEKNRLKISSLKKKVGEYGYKIITEHNLFADMAFMLKNEILYLIKSGKLVMDSKQLNRRISTVN